MPACKARPTMHGDRTVEAVGDEDLEPGPETPDLLREIAFDTPEAVVVRARAEGEVTSGWHTHGERAVFGYLVEGKGIVEFGREGDQDVEVQEGEFFHVPPGVVHRDVNPVEEPQEAVAVYVGEGPKVVNVDGPPEG